MANIKNAEKVHNVFQGLARNARIAKRVLKSRKMGGKYPNRYDQSSGPAIIRGKGDFDLNSTS